MTIPLYPPIVTEQDLSPAAFGSEIDELCQKIRDATKGLGANRQKVIDALATQDPTARTKIAMRYEELFGKNLKELMKSEFRGDFGNTLQLLALPPHQAECCMLHKACKGVGASVPVIYSIMCGRTNSEMELLKKTFFKMYDKDLGKLLGSELRGNTERIVFNCLQAAEEDYNPQFHTQSKAKEDAEIIHSFGQGKRFGTNERGIFKILCSAPKEYLEMINLAYADKYGYTLPKAMEKELSGLMEGGTKDATLHLIGMKLKPYETLAGLVRKGMCCNQCFLKVQAPHTSSHVISCSLERIRYR